jgi:hypothetical protein
MTYPQQGYPQPGYPQIPQQPGYPQAPAPVGYPQQPAPQYAAPPVAPQQGQPQLAAGTLDAFWSQPSVGGGAALKFEVNTQHVFVVPRDVTNADIQQQTNPQNQMPQTYKDGRPKFVMKVPARVAPSQAHPEGQAQWYCAGGARDELVRAMSAVGAPQGPPESGAVLIVKCTGTRPSGPGMNPAKTYKVQYLRPGPEAANFAAQCGIVISDIPPYNGQAAPAPQQAPAPAAPEANGNGAVPAPAPQVQQPPVPQVPVAQVPQVPQPAAQPAPVAQAPAPAAPAAPAAGGELTPQQLQLLAQLTGQPAG